MSNFKEVQRKAKLTPEQIDYCLLHMLRVPTLFDIAKQQLKAEDFDRNSELYYSLIWGAALEVAEKNGGKLPDNGAWQIIDMELGARIKRAGSMVPQNVAETAFKLLSWVYNFEQDNLNPSYYRDYVRDLIIERTVIRTIVQDISLADKFGRPDDLPAKLEAHAQTIQSIFSNPTQASRSAFPVERKIKPVAKYPTGLPFMDKYMNGGQVDGEVYGVLGPTGTGKTTLGVMLAVEAARYWAAMYRQGKIKRRRVSHIVSWEQDYDRMMERVWEYAADIHSDSLEAARNEIDPIPLSTTGNLKDYELEIFTDKLKVLPKDQLPGEYERLKAVSEELRDFLRIADFSGYEDPNIGTNGVEEVSAMIESVNKEEDVDTGVIILDYAGTAVKRMISAQGLKYDHMRHYLGDWGNLCRYKLASKFNCPVWALHQLNAEANRRSPTAEQHHSYASEAGLFVENMWFAFVFGTKDREANTAYLWCTKERRARGSMSPPILEIQGSFCRLVDVSDKFQVDSTTRRFIPKKLVSGVMRPQRYPPKVV